MTRRRLCRDYERRPDTSESFIYWAMIGIMARRIARHGEADADGDLLAAGGEHPPSVDAAAA
jgi:hypothetical protein